MDHFDTSVLHVDDSDESAEIVVLKANTEQAPQTVRQNNLIVVASTASEPDELTGLRGVKLLQNGAWPQDLSVTRRAMVSTVERIGQCPVLFYVQSCGTATGSLGCSAQINALITLIQVKIRSTVQMEYPVFISCSSDCDTLRRVLGGPEANPMLHLSGSAIELNSQINTYAMMHGEKASIVCHGQDVELLVQQMQLRGECEFCKMSARRQVVLPDKYTPAVCENMGSRTHYLAFFGSTDKFSPRLDSGSSNMVVSYNNVSGSQQQSWGIIMLRRRSADAEAPFLRVNECIKNMLDCALGMDEHNAIDLLQNWVCWKLSTDRNASQNMFETQGLVCEDATRGLQQLLNLALRVSESHVQRVVALASRENMSGAAESAPFPAQVSVLGRSCTMGAADFQRSRC